MQIKDLSRSGRTAVAILLVGLIAVLALPGYAIVKSTNVEAVAGDVRASSVVHATAAASAAPHFAFNRTFATAEVNRAAGASAADGAEIYMTRCMSCHQMNGRGVPGVFPPLAGSEWVTENKGALIRIVLNGMTGEIEVAGETYSGAMPPWQSFLDDTEVAELLTYIRSTWGNEASEVTPEEVAKVRAAVADRKEPWTDEELLQAENRGIPGEDSTATSE